MGWWSTEIMGGDTPMDWEDHFFTICDADKYDDDGNLIKIKKDVFAKKLKHLVNRIDIVKHEPQIGWQVLAVMMMEAGAKIPDDIKEQMVLSCETDPWSKENPERKTHTEALKATLNTYEDKPIKFQFKGLFAVIGERLAKDKEGLK